MIWTPLVAEPINFLTHTPSELKKISHRPLIKIGKFLGSMPKSAKNAGLLLKISPSCRYIFLPLP